MRMHQLQAHQRLARPRYAAQQHQVVCTNQGLAVTAAAIHLALLGPAGLRNVAAACHDRTRQLVDRIEREAGVRRRFTAPFFHEAVLQLEMPVAPVLQGMREAGILGGLDLSGMRPELRDCMLVCATETKADADLDRHSAALRAALTRAA